MCRRLSTDGAVVAVPDGGTLGLRLRLDAVDVRGRL